MASSHGQQFAFISAWLSHGNVRRAMRETGVASPTTAYRWIRAYERHGPPELQPHPTPPARRVATEIADQVVGLRQVNPTWGKERIARELAARYGTPVVSPTGVRSVLRQAGLWTPPAILVPHDPGSRTPIDHDWLIDELRRGIWLDLFNQPREAIQHLNATVWTALLLRPEQVFAVLREPEAGSWLLRGTLQLAHALINTGRWASALWYLRLVDDWLAREESRPSARQAAYQDAGERWVTGPGQWTAGHDPPPGAERVSLRQDDIWLETQQYLGVVLRDAIRQDAIDALTVAGRMLDAGGPRRISPHRVTHYQGVIGHDLATLKLRRDYPVWSVLEDLDPAEELLAHHRDAPMLASALLTRAKAIERASSAGRSGPALDRVERAVWTAFDYASRSSALITNVRVHIEGTELLLRGRNVTSEDRDRLAAAARASIDHGFAGQARKILESAQLLSLIPGYEQALRDMDDV